VFEEEQAASKAVPCMKAVGLVPASPVDIFKLMMDLSTARKQWDLFFDSGTVLETESRHADIVHLVSRPLWFFPCWASPRDLVLSRHWKHESDGSYTITWTSVSHASTPKSRDHIRGNVLGSCVVIEPVKGDEGISNVTYAMQIDPQVPRFRLGMLAGASVALLIGSACYSEAGLIALLAVVCLLVAGRALLANLLGADFWIKGKQGFHRQYSLHMLVSVGGLRDMINQTPELEDFISNTGIVYQLDKAAELFTDLPDKPPLGAAVLSDEGSGG